MGSERKKEPSYWVKWAAGIAASVIAAVLISQMKYDGNGEITVPSRHYDSLSGIGFRIPTFLPGVSVSEHLLTHVVTVARTPSESSNLSKLFGADQASSLLFLLMPALHAQSLAKHPQTTKSIGVDQKVRQNLAVELERNGERLTGGYIVEEIEGIVNVVKIVTDGRSTLIVVGKFPPPIWRQHENDIKSSFDSISVNESVAAKWLLGRLDNLNVAEQTTLKQEHGENWCGELLLSLEYDLLDPLEVQRLQSESQDLETKIRQSLDARCGLRQQQ